MIYSTEIEAQDVHCTFYEQKNAYGKLEGFVHLRVNDFRTQIIRYVWVDNMILAPNCPLFKTRQSFLEYLQLNKVWGGLDCDGERTVVIPDYDVPGTDAIPLTFEQVQDQLKSHPFLYTSEA